MNGPQFETSVFFLQNLEVIFQMLKRRFVGIKEGLWELSFDLYTIAEQMCMTWTSN